jgi:pimeloyl-ACP methyl ester carboxylesterase
MMKENYLPLRGYQGRSVQNLFWSNTEDPEGLAVLFPGYSYPTDAPLFHYLKLHLLSRNWAVLALEYRYNENREFLDSPDEEQERFISEEALLIREQLESQISFNRCLFAGKSLGTTILYEMLKTGLPWKRETNRFLWFTPAESNKEICRFITQHQIPSLYIIGDKDPYFDADTVNHLKHNILGDCLVLPGAGHLLNHNMDALKTIDNMNIVMRFLLDHI